ncbi:DeoR/GlpR family DNA-binding transcription regulator [Pelagicoccus sp. SDUM812003]|uniref:DeoR/GlpR family DNA-binding transcription regulator n=1 Tax=Pelagicoccus sp. SDUM812003 TaxID=3041267 RepID=UPI00280FAEF8|nr:DeoR/GlpR family DNA-binding transcription regulator [Pelagicoccus sp. SDUM812003]MDQ8204642.1 DeoR/GlpR family DNA-binding transcription regulator [Pelagicoccus sp. SDUM812003]
MLASERQSQIGAFIQAAGSARTTELAKKFSVTEETIRRDFEALHEAGIIQRTHGGAIALDHPRRTLSADQRSIRNVEAKRVIATIATDLVRPREIIFIDASSTALQFAMALPDIDLKIITNAHDVIAALAERKSISVVGTGGNFDRESRSYVGPQVAECTARYHITKMFFSCDGIDPEKGASEQDESQALLKQAVLEHADQAFLLADSSKWRRRSAYYFCPCARISGIITEAKELFTGDSGQSDLQIISE